MRHTCLLLAVLALLGCDDDPDLPEDPPLAVPGQEVTPPPPPTMPTTAPEPFDPPLAIPGVAEIPPPPMPEMPPGMQPGQMPPGMQPGQMPPGMQPGQVPPGMQPGMAPAAPFSLARGFMPDPHVVPGLAGGPVDASTMSPDCLGNIASAPNHTVQLTTDYPMLRFLVSSATDTTLVIRSQDGTFRCNDDATNGAEGLNPVVEGTFAPGVYSVWVGTYGAPGGPPASYVLGISELPHVTTAQLASAGGAMQPTQ